MPMIRRAAFALLLVLFHIGRAGATTWNEPWHADVVRAASAFGLYEVTRSDAKSLTLKRLKRVAGEDTGDTVDVSSFYALRLTSLSGDGPELRIPPKTRAYFYLKRTAGGWAVATPTAGWAPLRPDGKVFATYRMSAHQALIESPVYELTQRCYFTILHGAGKCEPGVAAFIDEELAKPPAVLDAQLGLDGLSAFFRQHVALETAWVMNYPLSAQVLAPFLATSDMHVQISAVRALAGSRLPDKAERLVQAAEDDRVHMTARIMAVIMLREIGAHAMKQRLLDYAATAPTEESGLGIGIMDPRIGTAFPRTLAEAAKQVAAEL